MAQNNTIKKNDLNSLNHKKPLRKHTEEALNHYFNSLNGARPGDLYDLVLGDAIPEMFRDSTCSAASLFP